MVLHWKCIYSYIVITIWSYNVFFYNIIIIIIIIYLFFIIIIIIIIIITNIRLY